MIFARWKNGESRRINVRDPLAADDPHVTLPCPACDKPIGTSRRVQVVAVGPVDEQDERAHNEDLWYLAVAALMHQDCADRLTDSSLDLLISELAIVPTGGV